MKYHAALNTSSYPTASCQGLLRHSRSSLALQRREDEQLGAQLVFGYSHGQPGKQTYVIRGSNRYAVLERMPAHMQDLLVEVDLIRIGLLPHSPPLPTRSSSRTSSPRTTLLSTTGWARRAVDRCRDADFLCFERRLVGLKDHFRFSLRVRWIDHEVVVVAAGHDITAVTAEDHFKLIKNAVIFVRVAESRAKMLVYWDSLNRLTLHIHIPDLDGKVVARENIAAIVRETNVGNRRDDFGEE
jgi:hypothetical protein